jgi:hypothetical protein
MKKKAKRHIHKWFPDECCEHCGHYTEYCMEEKPNGERCDAIRRCDPSGKCEIDKW